MYLRTIYELEEEGVVPLRARIAERLRPERTDREPDRGPHGTRRAAWWWRATGTWSSPTPGRSRAVSVMRKHRLAERLLIDVIGLEWELVHAEACRWEHVMSDAVERKLVALLDNPTISPYGNPIPGLDELTAHSPESSALARRRRSSRWVCSGSTSSRGAAAAPSRCVGSPSTCRSTRR